MRQSSHTLHNPATVATVTIAVLAILFAMREAKTIVVPALFAFFLAAVADWPVSWLERKGLSRVLGVSLATVNREWRTARMWLEMTLSRNEKED